MNTQNETTRARRLQIGLFGRCNAGKSSLCNALSGQDVALVSPTPGTTTDPVEKVMEMAPLGPIVLLDTAGLDDHSVLGKQRIERTRNVLKRVDVALLVLENMTWGEVEQQAVADLSAANIPFLVVCNCHSAELVQAAQSFRPATLPAKTPILAVRAQGCSNESKELNALRQAIAALAPDNAEPPMLRDLLPAQAGRLILVCPQDTGAPKGRLIMPQVQAIRDALDGRALCVVVTQEQYQDALDAFKEPPHLVVCDSQVVHLVASLTPASIPLTTFSILMARLKGDLPLLAQGAAALTQLKAGDTVLIQEACSHHAQKDDIGRVKIPRLLQKLAHGPVQCVMVSGRHWSTYEGNIKAVIHCGACTLTRREMNNRLEEALHNAIPMTNYGIAISLAQGVLTRTLAPFPDALAAWHKALERLH